MTSSRYSFGESVAPYLGQRKRLIQMRLEVVHLQIQGQTADTLSDMIDKSTAEYFELGGQFIRRSNLECGERIYEILREQGMEG